MTQAPEVTIGDIPATEWIGKRVKVKAKSGGGGKRRDRHGLIVTIRSVKGGMIHFTSPQGGADSAPAKDIKPWWEQNGDMLSRRMRILQERAAAEVEVKPSVFQQRPPRETPPAPRPAAPKAEAPPVVEEPVIVEEAPKVVTYRCGIPGRSPFPRTAEELRALHLEGVVMEVNYESQWRPIGEVVVKLFPELAPVVKAPEPVAEPPPITPPKPTMPYHATLPEVTITLKAGADPLVLQELGQHVAGWHSARRDVAEATEMLHEATARFHAANEKLVAGGVLIHDPLKPTGPLARSPRAARTDSSTKLFERIVTNKEQVAFAELQEYPGYKSNEATHIQVDRLRQGFELVDPQQRMWAVALSDTKHFVAKPVAEAS